MGLELLCVLVARFKLLFCCMAGVTEEVATTGMAANKGWHGTASTDAADEDHHHATAERGIRWESGREDLNNLIHYDNYLFTLLP